MKIIRHKTNHQILCAGYIETEKPDYDATIWEEVEGELPEGYEMYKEKPVLIGTELEAIVRDKFKTIPLDNRFELYKEVESVLNFIRGDRAITESEFEYNYNKLTGISSLSDETLEQLKTTIIAEILERYRWA